MVFDFQKKIFKKNVNFTLIDFKKMVKQRLNNIKTKCIK